VAPTAAGRDSNRRTREDLLEATASVLRRRSFPEASVGEIAAAAGYTVGAVYSNFGGKQDLLLALVERESQRVSAEISTAAESATDAPEKLRRGAAAWVAFLDREQNLYAAFMEFWAISVRNSELRSRNAELWGAVRTELGSLVERHARLDGKALTLPADQVGAAVMALGDGLAVQRLEAPEAIPESLLGRLLDALIPALIREI
jgi:AcrR family transcriptional regulator